MNHIRRRDRLNQFEAVQVIDMIDTLVHLATLLAMRAQPDLQREHPLVQPLAANAEWLLQLWFGPAT